ncbi:MAG: L-threonylcarbamoyladenylate synthase [Coriobacteriia bacterium]|nr:L-threonylcarbamoyladenylate synthase [Coriobacteriia bacterium]
MTITASTVDTAVLCLRDGQPVAFPTDTVFGVGVSVGHAPSPHILYQLKQRAERKPIAWLVGSVSCLQEYGSGVPPFAQVLAETFWPGPLTLVVRASSAVPQAFRSDVGTIGLRMPNNATALRLLQGVGCPLATTSANVAGRKPPASFQDVDPAFAQLLAAVVASDAPCSGVASTVVDCTGDHPHIIREGAITIADILALS